MTPARRVPCEHKRQSWDILFCKGMCPDCNARLYACGPGERMVVAAPEPEAEWSDADMDAAIYGVYIAARGDYTAGSLDRAIFRAGLAARAPQDSRPANVTDLEEYAWTILCNVSGGDWTKQSEEWQGAVKRFHDQYHAKLAARAPQAHLSLDQAFALAHAEARDAPQEAPAAGLPRTVQELTDIIDGAVDAAFRSEFKCSWCGLTLDDLRKHTPAAPAAEPVHQGAIDRGEPWAITAAADPVAALLDESADLCSTWPHSHPFRVLNEKLAAALQAMERERDAMWQDLPATKHLMSLRDDALRELVKAKARVAELAQKLGDSCHEAAKLRELHPQLTADTNAALKDTP